jgi:hypothetical protein
VNVFVLFHAKRSERTTLPEIFQHTTKRMVGSPRLSASHHTGRTPCYQVVKRNKRCVRNYGFSSADTDTFDGCQSTPHGIGIN